MLFPLNGISAWDSTNPVYFGCGLAKKVGSQMKSMGVTKVFIGCDKGVRGAGLADIVVKSCEEAELPYFLFDAITADPADLLVDEVARIAKEQGIDGWIAIGGGSVMDTCKCANLLQKYEPPINQYFLGEAMGMAFDKNSLYPICVMPTTAGTGSEVSPGAVISDSATHAKRPVDIGVDLAIDDPELTLGLPLSITINTAIDAWAHGAEGVISNCPNVFSETFGLECVRLVTKYLPLVIEDPKNSFYREQLCKASVFGGLALRGAVGGLAHRFATGVSTLFGKPHGLTVGLFLPATFKFTAEAAPQKIKLVAEAMGETVPEGISNAELGQLIFDAIAKMLRDVNFPTFESFCESQEYLLDHCDAFWTEAEFGDPMTASCARLCQNKEEALNILKESYSVK